MREKLCLLFIFLIFVFCSFSLTVFCDLSDEYDYTNSYSVNYTYLEIDTDNNSLINYVLITVNDSRAKVKVNNDFGFIFYTDSLFDKNNKIEIFLIENNFVLYYNFSYFFVNLSRFEKTSASVNISYFFSDTDFDGFDDLLSLDSNVNSYVIYYFDSRMAAGFRYANISIYDSDLFLKGIYVNSTNHFYEVNKSISVLSYNLSPKITSVSESFSNNTLYINISCSKDLELYVKIYDDSNDFLYDARMFCKNTVIFPINSSYVLLNMINGPYHLYINSYHYMTNYYSYIDFEKAIFESKNESELYSNDSLDNSQSDDSKSSSAKSPSNSYPLLPLTSNISNLNEENQNSTNSNEKANSFELSSNFSKYNSDEKTPSLYLYLIDVASGNNLGLSNNTKNPILLKSSKNSNNLVTSFAINGMYLKSGIIAGVVLVVFLAIFWYVRKKALL